MKKLIWFLIAISFTAAAVADPVDPLPADAFFSSSAVTSARISPDGKYIAMVVSDQETGDESKYLAIIGSDDRKIRSGFKVADGHEIWKFWWANPERVVIATSTETGAISIASADGALYAINVDKTQAVQLLGDIQDDSGESPDSKPGDDRPATGSHINEHLKVAKKDSSATYLFDSMLFIPGGDARRILVQAVELGSNRREALDLDVYTGETRVVIKSPVVGGGVDTDASGNVRLAWGANELDGSPAIYYRDASKDAPWQDLSSLYRGSDPAGDDCGTDGMASDGKTFYWVCRTAYGTQGVFNVDPKTSDRKVLFADPSYDVIDEIYDAGKLIAVETMPGQPQIHFIDKNDRVSMILSALQQAFPGQTVTIANRTEGGDTLMVFVSSDRNPGDYYIFNSKTLKADYLFSALDRIDPDEMSPRQPIMLKARDGLVLHGYITLPLGKAAKKLPLIVLPHGGPHGYLDTWGWDSEAEYLSNHGYAVLQVNFRGSGGYGMQFQDAGYLNWGTTMQDDLADATQWAIQQGIADPARICIYGSSYGGYAALESVIRYPSLYKCAVGNAGVYDLTLQGKYSDTSQSIQGRDYLKTVLGDDKKLLRKYSPAFNANSISVPVFIAYGGRDQRVVPDNAKELIEALKQSGKTFDVLFKPYEVHGFQKAQDKIEFYTKLLQFVDKNIGH